jgi:hypothetical protein
VATITNEIWIAMASLAEMAGDVYHTVTNKELAEKVEELFEDQRSGVYTHISQHVVAQKNLNTGYNKCFLTAIGRGIRRLFLPGDNIHESRYSNPETIPQIREIPAEYQYLLEWYKQYTRSSLEGSIHPEGSESKIEKDRVSKRIIRKSTISTKGHLTLSDFVSLFDGAYRNFYSSNASYKSFREGPCIHFHRKTISLWEDQIKNGKDTYRAILADDEFPEAIYATLTAWGMNRLGGGPKLKDYGDFKANLLSIADYLEGIRGFNILQSERVKRIIETIYSKIDPSENTRDLIAKSKTLHHLNPELFPPIDRRYTLNLLIIIDGLPFVPSLNSVTFENYWKILSIFQLLVNKISYEGVRRYVGRGIMDTSLTKIIDNAIIGFSDLKTE